MDDHKDVYSSFATSIFGLPYEECQEWKDDKPYVLGKRRRTIAERFLVSMYALKSGEANVHTSIMIMAEAAHEMRKLLNETNLKECNTTDNE